VPLHFALEQKCENAPCIVSVDYDDKVGAYKTISRIEYMKVLSIVIAKHDYRIKQQIKNK
jgi:hypothetical protein